MRHNRLILNFINFIKAETSDKGSTVLSFVWGLGFGGNQLQKYSTNE